jgi:hypothetical protein
MLAGQDQNRAPHDEHVGKALPVEAGNIRYPASHMFALMTSFILARAYHPSITAPSQSKEEDHNKITNRQLLPDVTQHQ